MTTIEVPVCSCGKTMEQYVSGTVGWFCGNCDRLQPEETEVLSIDTEGNNVYYKRKETVEDAIFKAVTKSQIKGWYEQNGV